jgi:hypothetical protein
LLRIDIPWKVKYGIWMVGSVHIHNASWTQPHSIFEEIQPVRAISRSLIPGIVVSINEETRFALYRLVCDGRCGLLLFTHKSN